MHDRASSPLSLIRLYAASASAITALVPGIAPAQSRPQFLTPMQMPAPINVAGSSSYSIALSTDGLRAMVETDRAGGRGGRDLFLLQRPSTQASFTAHGPMGFCGPHDEGAELSGPHHDIGIEIGPDDARAFVTVLISGTSSSAHADQTARRVRLGHAAEQQRSVGRYRTPGLPSRGRSRCIDGARVAALGLPSAES